MCPNIRRVTRTENKATLPWTCSKLINKKLIFFSTLLFSPQCPENWHHCFLRQLYLNIQVLLLLIYCGFIVLLLSFTAHNSISQNTQEILGIFQIFTAEHQTELHGGGVHGRVELEDPQGPFSQTTHYYDFLIIIMP